MDGLPVEARSLGSLVTLASNPPAYPRNPTQKPLEPLVLYIVRVPGSKDVFLSPLKPPTKSSLSPESLNASLYFLHVAGPKDDEILESIEEERHTQRQVKKPIRQTSKFAILNRIRRKPVPGVDSQQLESASEREVVPPLPLRPRRIIEPDPQTRYETEPENISSGDIQPAGEIEVSQPPSLPPRPRPTEEPKPDTRRWSARPFTSTSGLELPSQALQGQSSGTVARASWDGGGRPLFESNPPSRPRSPLESLPLPDDEGPKPPLPLRPKRSCDGPRDVAQTPPFHLTLIRRDPTHSSQWNVGTIDNMGSTPSEGTPDGSIRVEITTPGYQKFAVDTSRMSFESLGIKLPASARNTIIVQPPSSSEIPATAAAVAGQPLSQSGPEAGPVKFTRLLKLSQPTQTSSHHRLQSSHGEKFNLASPKASKYPHRSTAHYNFTSIWNGQCSFTTAANGRTLRCKHTIPAPSGGGSSPASSTTIAEIRFNLPTLLPSPSSSGDPNGSPTKMKNTWFSELDLSLARERAGGGLRGNSAKLGKLVIEDEGLKMLDLVVASCMGVFWKYYEHT